MEYNPFSDLASKLTSIEHLLLEQKQEIELLKENSKPPMPDRYIDKKQCAALAAVSQSTINNWIRAGHLDDIVFRFDSAVRIHYQGFLDFLAAQKRKK